jgi:hypothetical protein
VGGGLEKRLGSEGEPSHYNYAIITHPGIVPGTTSWERNMTKRVKLLLLAIAAVLVGASQSSADDVVPAYITTLYSDATHQTVVGHIYPDCRVFPYVYVQYTLVGTYSYYGIDEYVGSCGPNGWEPIE